MSDRRMDQDLSQVLTAWMDDVAPERPPARLLEETFSQTMGAEQVRVYPWHKLAIGSLGRSATRSRVPFVLLAVVGLLVVAFAVALSGGGPRGTIPIAPSPSPSVVPSPSRSATPSVAVLPAPISVTAEATIAIQDPIDMAATESGDLWVMVPGRLDRIDPRTNKVSDSVAFGPTTDLYSGFAAHTKGLWATDSDSGTVYRVDPATLKVAAAIPGALSPKGVLATDTATWVADVHGGTVLRIDPATNKVVATITVGPTGNSGPNWLAEGLGSIWVDIPNNRTLTRIDPVTNEIQAAITAPGGMTPCGGIAVTESAAWVTSCSASNVIARIDPSSNTVVATVDPGKNGFNVTLINGVPWISVDGGDATTGSLVRIDPATNTIDRVLVPGGSFGGGGDIVVADGSVWVVDGYNASVLRLPLAAFGP